MKPVARVEHSAPGHVDWQEWPQQLKQGTELYASKERIDKALKLLKQAGDNLDIRTSQEVRALRFKILQFLEEQDDNSN